MARHAGEEGRSTRLKTNGKEQKRIRNKRRSGLARGYEYRQDEDDKDGIGLDWSEQIGFLLPR